MSPNTSQLLQAARSLSRAERAELASAIWDTVEDEMEKDVVLAPEWKAEIRKRIEESDRGDGITLSEEEVEQRLRERYGPLPD